MTCAVENYKEGVNSLLGARADVNRAGLDGNTALHMACFFGHKEIVEILVDHLAFLDVENYNGVTPLGMACINKQAWIVRYMLSIGADPSQGMVTPLQVALMYRADEVVDLLLHAKADPRIYRRGFKDIELPVSDPEMNNVVTNMGLRNVGPPIEFVFSLVMILSSVDIVDKELTITINHYTKMLTRMCEVIKPFDWPK